jgi:hypothetical protein
MERERFKMHREGGGFSQIEEDLASRKLPKSPKGVRDNYEH